MIDEWRINLFDQLILRVLENGFSDMDFEGWADMPVEGRIKAVTIILEQGGLASIIFRRSFARALWGETPACEHGQTNTCLKSHKRPGFIGPACDMHRQQMVIAENDDWMLYLKDNT